MNESWATKWLRLKMTFKAWRQRREEAKKCVRFTRGYNCCATALRNGEDPDVWANYVDASHTFRDHDEFDKGVSRAIYDFQISKESI